MKTINGIPEDSGIDLEARQAISNMSISGTAEAGTTSSIMDTSKNFGAGLIGKLVKIQRGDTEYIREISAVNEHDITFPDLAATVNASVTIGSGAGAEGQIELNCIGTLGGAAGNDVSASIVHGSTNTGETHAAFANGVLTFTVDTNALSEQRTLAAGDVSNILAADNLDDQFTASEGFTAGNLPIGGGALPFAGGSDGVAVQPGDAYSILAWSELEQSISELTDNGAIKGFKVLTQAAYDAIETPDPEIVYLISG